MVLDEKKVQELLDPPGGKAVDKEPQNIKAGKPS